jgi:hypothetical protein
MTGNKGGPAAVVHASVTASVVGVVVTVVASVDVSGLCWDAAADDDVHRSRFEFDVVVTNTRSCSLFVAVHGLRLQDSSGRGG